MLSDLRYMMQTPRRNICNPDIMTSSNGNIFRVTGLLCGEFTGHRWIPRTKASDVFFDLHRKKNSWVNSREAGDLRRHCAHYDITVMETELHVLLSCDILGRYVESKWQCSLVQHCTDYENINRTFKTPKYTPYLAQRAQVRHWRSCFTDCHGG